MRVEEARLIEVLRRAFGADAQTPSMFSMYLRERFYDVWMEISK